MTRLEENLLQALRQIDQAVRSISGADPKPNVRPLLERLDALASQLPEDTDPTLLHYMRRGSYEKARHWLEAKDQADASLPT